MLKVEFTCAACAEPFTMLIDAQKHCNVTGHLVRVQGTLTADHRVVADKQKIEDAARKRAFDAEILRRARDRGLVGK